MKSVWQKRKMSLKNVLGTRGGERQERREKRRRVEEWKGVRGVGRGLIPRRLR